MMKKNDPNLSKEMSSEKSSSGPEKGLAILVILMFFIPFVMIMAIWETEPYYVVPGESIADSVKAAGITVVSEKDSTWNVNGATGGKTYVLSDKSGNSVTISTQAFDSAESRDAAIQLYNSNTVGKGKPVGSLFVVGEHLVYVTPSNSGILKDLSAELEKIRSS